LQRQVSRRIFTASLIAIASALGAFVAVAITLALIGLYQSGHGGTAWTDAIAVDRAAAQLTTADLMALAAALVVGRWRVCCSLPHRVTVSRADRTTQAAMTSAAVVTLNLPGLRYGHRNGISLAGPAQVARRYGGDGRWVSEWRVGICKECGAHVEGDSRRYCSPACQRKAHARSNNHAARTRKHVREHGGVPSAYEIIGKSNFMMPSRAFARSAGTL
jgi:hypothetical protein